MENAPERPLHELGLGQPNAREDSLQKRGRIFPKGRDGPVRASARIGMKDAIIPTPRAGRIFRIMANHIEKGSRVANAHRLGVLRHEQHMAALIYANLADKLAEALRVSQIQ